ncbi:MAG: helix-turn-helix domain-containing protein [Alphaproteobacteria bacterium]
MTENIKTLTAGEMLKHSRTTGRRKRELATIAKQLCIKEEFLDALETGNYKKIPELIYILGFARNYAIELDLDPEEIVNKIKEEMGIISEENKYEKETEEEIVNKKRCGLETFEKIRGFLRKNWKWISTIIVSIIIILLAIWGVSKYTDHHDNKEKVEQVALYTPKFNLPVKEEFGTEDKATANIVLQATQESWIKIEDAQGETMFSRVLVPGEVYYVPSGNVKGTFGNAGGIDIWVNGALAPKLGASHSRKVGVVMTPETLMPQI